MPKNLSPTSRINGFLSSHLNVSDYRKFLEGCLCWYDGAPTHRSSGAQRQCPRCRSKWNFIGRQKHFLLLIEYCKGSKAGEAARLAGTSRNTAQVSFLKFDQRVASLVRKLHRRGGVSIVTQETTMMDLERLRRNSGKRTPAEAVSRRIFFHGMNSEERVERLIVPDLVEAIQCSLALFPGKTRRTLPKPQALLELRPHMTEAEWIVYVQVAMKP